MKTKVGKGRPQMNKPNIPAGVILLGAIIAAISALGTSAFGLFGWSIACLLAGFALINAYRWLRGK